MSGEDVYFAGLDIGTTGCKIVVFEKGGRCCGRIYRDYPLHRGDQVHEVDAGEILKSVRCVLQDAASTWPSIRTIGVTSFGETFVLLDEADRPLTPSLLYTDTRGTVECEVLCQRIGRKKLAKITGTPPHPMYSISKLMWLKENRRRVWEQARRVLLMEDYIVYHLTGKAQISYSLAARTMAFDIRTCDWCDDILSAAEIDRDLLSKPVPTGTAAGLVLPDIADDLGLSLSTVIASCGHDQVASAVGAGLLETGDAVDSSGTVECITTLFSEIPDNDLLAKGHYAVVPYVVPNTYVCYAFTFTGGAVIKWFVDHFAGYAAQQAEAQGTSVYEQLETFSADDDPSELLLLPHFAGAATPYMDYGSKGALVGLTLGTTTHDVYRAVMEGIAYEMRLNCDLLNQAGVSIHSFRATGGGANSRTWTQIKTDILGVPFTVLESEEAGALGAALLAAVSLGIYRDLGEATGLFVKKSVSFSPRKAKCARYTSIYKKYERLYDAIRPLV